MLKFLAQIVNDKVKHDFVFILERSQEYYEWNGNPIHIEYCTLEDINSGCKLIDCDDITSYIPVGTVEFVHAFINNFIKENGSTLIKPINVPKELWKYNDGYINNFTITDFNRANVYEDLYKNLAYNYPIFVKSNSTIKDPINGQYNLIDIIDINKIPNGNYQIRDYMDILSEYRCFIYKDNIVGMKHYSGEFETFPNMTEIYHMIEDYKWDEGRGTAPEAYTLDIAILTNDETVVIECHDFYSCGLYGFDDYKSYPYMLARAFNKIKKEINK